MAVPGLGHYEGRGAEAISPTRHVVYCRLRVPDQREEPFFPSARARHVGLSAQEPSPDSPARVAASAPNGITRSPSPHYGLPLRVNSAGSCGTVPFAEPAEPVNLQRPRLLAPRKSAGMGMVRAVRHSSSSNFLTPPSFSSAMQRQFSGEPAGEVRCHSPRHIDSRVPESGPHDSGPACGDRTSEHGRDRRPPDSASSAPPSGSVDIILYSLDLRLGYHHSINDTRL